MLALIKISQFLYFLLFMTFVVFIVVHQMTSSTGLHIHIVLLFSFLLLPLIDGLLNIFIKEKKIYDGRIFFAVAILLFCFIGMYLVFGQNAKAEALSIYAYYSLIAGVVSQIIENIISPKKAQNV